MHDHSTNGGAATPSSGEILVVDDNAGKRLALRAMLAPLGHPVVEADSGRAALSAVMHHRFAVVLMDVRMPTLDGFETAKLIRQWPESARTPIIFVTAFGLDEIQTADAYASGAVDFIFAPILPDVLQAKVSAFVDLFVQAQELRNSLESVSALNTALRDSEVRARAVLLNVADGIVTSGEGGRIESFNESARRMFGYREQEVIGQPLDLIVAPGAGDEFSESARGKPEPLTADDIAAEPIETMGLRRNGTTFPIELDVSQMYIGERTFTISCIRDISARKLAETEKANLEAQLRETQKLEAIGRLAGGVAHDFNSLLTVIGGYTDELINGLDGQPALIAVAEEIRHAADRAISLTAQLLAFSRRQQLDPQTLNLNAVIGNIGPMLQRLIGEDLVLVTHLDPELRAVTADASQIDQVIVNLVANARDATPTGGTITIRTSNATLDPSHVAAQPAGGLDPGRHVILSVTDTGVGLDEQTQSQIFDPFFTTKEIGKGTGLGLATVYGIARQSGGFTRVDSEPGRGATFTVCLPAAQGDAEICRAPSVEPTAQVARGSETVLVVEDDERLRTLIRRILVSNGYTVLDAADGAAALRAFDTHEGEIQLVLSDTVMPGISGLELSDQLLARRPDIKLLLMSGYSPRALDDRGLLNRDAAFIQKPFTSAELARVARTLLDSPEHPALVRSAERS